MNPGIVRLLRWYKNSGDRVRIGEAICEIDVHGTTVEVPAWRDGRIHRLLAVGEEIKAANGLAIIRDEADS